MNYVMKCVPRHYGVPFYDWNTYHRYVIVLFLPLQMPSRVLHLVVQTSQMKGFGHLMTLLHDNSSGLRCC